MKLGLGFRAGDDVRVVWLLAFCVLAAGSLYVQTQYQTAIRLSHERTETLYRETVANERIIRQAVSLHALQQRAQADLARVSQDTSLPETTARLLSMLYRSAAVFDARVLEVQPGEAQVPAAVLPLHATALTIRVRGKFRNILRFVEDLSHHATLISVSDTEMAPAIDSQSNPAEPRLDATIHAVIYRVALPNNKESSDAPAG